MWTDVQVVLDVVGTASWHPYTEGAPLSAANAGVTLQRDLPKLISVSQLGMASPSRAINESYGAVFMLCYASQLLYRLWRYPAFDLMLVHHMLRAPPCPSPGVESFILDVLNLLRPHRQQLLHCLY